MRQNLKDFLFSKGILVGDENAQNPFEVIFALAKKFSIKITEGHELATVDTIYTAAYNIGYYVPKAFYEGFPVTVKELTKEEYLFDQLIAYATTYGLGCFTDPTHSLFERDFERVAYDGVEQVNEFKIVTEEKAMEILTECVDNMLLGTRPLNETQMDVLQTLVSQFGYEVKECRCKDTIVRLILDSRITSLAEQISLSDVIKVVERLNYVDYGSKKIKKLNLKNADRKFIAKLIDITVEKGERIFTECFEKKAIWCGLLHHIHYHPKTELGKKFCNRMRGSINDSVYSLFEKKMADGDVLLAADCLIKGKGQSALLRNLNYIISRCETDEEVEAVVSKIDSDNAVVLIQLLLSYYHYKKGGLRSFRFTRFEKLSMHLETVEEADKRKSNLSADKVKILKRCIKEQLEKTLKGRVGAVYVDDSVDGIALPINESASSGGFGVLPKGSRVPIEEGDIIRGFTYWEKVNDIDLSIIGIDNDGHAMEYSWRTMYTKDMSGGICYSGDQTSGFNGGSEYFDVDIDALLKKEEMSEFLQPNDATRYLVFCNNVYSNSTFDQIFCKAGYMVRSNAETGEIFEPKTVATSFKVTAQSTYAYLFAIDVKTRELIWLNIGKDSDSHISFEANIYENLRDYFDISDIIDLHSFFKMAATKVVRDPAKADIIISDNPEHEKYGKEIIHSYDFEKIAAILNTKK